MKAKDVDKLSASDIIKYPVWKYLNDDELGELKVAPVTNYPVKNTDNTLFGIEVILSCGKKILTIIGNFDIKKPHLNEHFIHLSFYKKDKWFNLARYFDIDYDDNGPGKLSKFLGIKIKDIFPIKFDLSKLIKGNKKVLIGKFKMKPSKKLSKSKLMELIFK